MAENMNIIQQLLSLMGQKQGQTNKGSSGSGDGATLLKQLLPSLLPGLGISNPMGAIGSAKAVLSPYQKGVEKALKQTGEQQAAEALQQGAPFQHIEQMVGLRPEQQQQQQMEQTQPQQPQEQAPEEAAPQQTGSQILNPKSPFTRQQLTPEGNLQLGGFLDFTGHPLEQIIKAQQITGQQPAQKGEIEKLNTEYGLKVLQKSQEQALDPNNPALKAQIFQEDLISLVSSFEDIPIKGRGAGGLGALMAGTTQIGKGEREEYNSKAEAFVYSFASYVAQQQGRALDKDEVKRFRDIIKLKTGDTRGSIKGKIQAMIDLGNTRLRSSGLQEMPKVDEFLKAIKESKTGKPSGSKTSTSGKALSDQEAYQEYLKAVGGK